MHGRTRSAGGGNGLLAEQALALLAGVLAALIEAMQQLLRFTVTPDHHHPWICVEL
jgi:hypothetical protein